MASKQPWLVQGIRRGRIYHFGDRQITPMAYVLRIRWPGGGWLWQTPWAVEVVHERGQETDQETIQRLPIRNITGVIKLLLVLGAAFVLVAFWRSRPARGTAPGKSTRR